MSCDSKKKHVSLFVFFNKTHALVKITVRLKNVSKIAICSDTMDHLQCSSSADLVDAVFIFVRSHDGSACKTGSCFGTFDGAPAARLPALARSGLLADWHAPPFTYQCITYARHPSL
jgi:hypothetical protein